MGTSHALLICHLSLPPFEGCQSNLSAFFVDMSCHIAYAICQSNHRKSYLVYFSAVIYYRNYYLVLFYLVSLLTPFFERSFYYKLHAQIGGQNYFQTSSVKLTALKKVTQNLIIFHAFLYFFFFLLPLPSSIYRVVSNSLIL